MRQLFGQREWDVFSEVETFYFPISHPVRFNRNFRYDLIGTTDSGLIGTSDTLWKKQNYYSL